ncbi:hypothetical protein QZM82_40630, partial [Burkholderia cepacia]|uniref:hypothetical protein n=1 Tax=Burkholderia cepacia TaxID=292 RepID=UPI0026566303
ATLLAYQAHCALSDFWGKLAWLLVHGSILSRVGASTKLGAVHNACVSWHQLAERFTFAGARAYIGTLYPVSDLEAETIVVKLLDKYWGKCLPHALWSAQNAIYSAGSDRRPYVVTGVYTQRLRVTAENVPSVIMKKLVAARDSWKRRLTAIGEDRSRKQIREFVQYYEREVEALRRAFTKDR